MQAARSFDLSRLREQVAGLARRGVYIGTSSWKYPGWRRLFYDEQRYIYRGKFSESRFDRLSLAEYAETFRTVCVDAAYYKFPDPKGLAEMTSQVPRGFQFTFKVTDQITIKNFSTLPRFGQRGAQANPNFLNADLFCSAFLKPLEPFHDFVGLLVFEFSKFKPGDYKSGREFLADLDQFLAKLPPGWRYAVEVRNRNFLRPEYFSVLARHRVAHVFNSWTEMPPLSEQVALEGSITTPTHAGARLLLKPGRDYEAAVELFKPYEELREPCDSARAGALQLLRLILTKANPEKLFLYINNRLEGNSFLTILALLEKLKNEPSIEGFNDS